MHKRIDHIVVRVKSLEQGMRDYEQKLGMKASKGPEELPRLGMKRAVFPIGDAGSFIELAEPLGADGAIAKSLAKHGEGLHLVALAVGDLKQAVAEMKARARASSRRTRWCSSTRATGTAYCTSSSSESRRHALDRRSARPRSAGVAAQNPGARP